MARREIVVYTDDVTGEESSDVETVLLVADGVAYEIDMSAATRTAYAAAIEPYRAAGRRIGRAAPGGNILRPAFGGASGAPVRTLADKEQNRAIREWWGRNQGRGGLPPLVERGRIPQPVLDLFQTHGGRSIEAAPDVEAGKEPRKAGSVGAEMSVSSKPDKAASAPPAATFSEAPQPAAKPRKSAASAKPRTATATATVPDEAPAKRTRSRRAAG